MTKIFTTYFIFLKVFFIILTVTDYPEMVNGFEPMYVCTCLCNSFMYPIILQVMHILLNYLKQCVLFFRVINIATQNYFSYWRNIKPLFVLTPIYREMMETIKIIRDASDEVRTSFHFPTFLIYPSACSTANVFFNMKE